jgi:TRAP-type C4-dicarboxylate transport system permease small subunit
VEVVAALFALFVMVIGGAKLVSLTFLLGQTSAALQVPLGFVYLALPVSGALIVFYIVLFLIERTRLLRGLPAVLPVLVGTTAEAYAERVDAVGESPSHPSRTQPEAL